MKKAFTLVELITVIILIGGLSLLIVSVVVGEIRRMEDTSYDLQISSIENAAINWFADQKVGLLKDERVQVYLGQLKQEHYLAVNIVDPKTNSEFPNDMIIEISNTEGIKAEVLDFGSLIYDYDFTYPSIKGEFIEVIKEEEVITYTDNGITAFNGSGDVISYQRSGGVTNQIGSYSLNYSVTEGSKTIEIIKTVLVRDLTGPSITFPDSLTIPVLELNSFDLKQDVVVTDSSGETTLDVEENLTGLAGTYTIKYIAVDKYGNETIEYRDVIVTE